MHVRLILEVTLLMPASCRREDRIPGCPTLEELHTVPSRSPRSRSLTFVRLARACDITTTSGMLQFGHFF